MRRRQGFTILELLIGLSVALVVLAAVVSLFSRTMQTQRRQRVRSELGRQGAFLGHLLQQELRVAGLGVPTATSVEGALPPPVHVLFAGTSAIGFVADVPRPDATFSTFGVLDDRPAGVRRLMWHTDQNGACAPQAAGCPVNETSVLYRGDTALCTDPGDRTCPWANRRLRPGEYFVAAAGNGSWANLLAAGSGDNASGLVMQASVSPDGGGVRGLLVDAASNAAEARGWPVAWVNTSRGDAPVDVRGQGFVSTPDRIFYRGCGIHGNTCVGGTGLSRVLERRQCWGPLLTNDAGWPTTADDADDARLGSGSFDPATTPLTTCTPWEVAARDVISVNFEYFAARSATSTSDSANRIVGAARLRSGQPRVAAGFGRVDIAEIRYTIKTSRVVDGFTVGQDVVGTVRLRNR
jgi:prepilin-type N-terminal cleavage/methylation domain-containing protein